MHCTTGSNLNLAELRELRAQMVEELEAENISLKQKLDTVDNYWSKCAQKRVIISVHHAER